MTSRKHDILPPNKLAQPVYGKASLSQQIEEACMLCQEAEFLERRIKDLRYGRRYDILQTLLWIKANEEAVREYAAKAQTKTSTEESNR